MALHALTSSVDPSDHYNMYFLVRYTAEPAYMLHMDIGDFICCNPKWAESMPYLRSLSGSDENLEVEQRLMDGMVSLIDPSDGSFYLPPEPLERKPWLKRGDYASITEPITSPFGDARLMLAMMAWHARDNDKLWLDRLHKASRGLAKLAIFKDDYAYYPEGKVGMEFAYLKYTGYRHREEPKGEHEGAEGSVLNYHGHQIRALARWYAMSGDKQTLGLAGKLSRFVMKPKLWGAQAESRWISGPEHAHFDGHHHGTCSVLRGLLEYGNVANDDEVKQFVRDGYEWARSRGIGQIGAFGDWAWKSQTEGCSVADMAALAIRLSDYGVGDYWDDADQYIRNHLAEAQLVDPKLLEQVSHGAVEYPNAYQELLTPQSPKLPWGPDNWDGALRRTAPQKPMADQVLERSLGQFTGFIGVDCIPYPVSCGCCSGNLTNALYYAWESIVRSEGDFVQVNLLLNRASQWADVDSYLPYEGRVVIHNKTARKLAVRVPRWADKKAIRSQVDGRPASPFFVGNYLMFDRVAPHELVSISFPMVVEQASCTAAFDKKYSLTFKGGTLIDVSPRTSSPVVYPIYRRAHYNGDRAPMKSATRFVASNLSRW
jgi:hypothetical protein